MCGSFDCRHKSIRSVWRVLGALIVFFSLSAFAQSEWTAEDVPEPGPFQGDTGEAPLDPTGDLSKTPDAASAEEAPAAEAAPKPARKSRPPMKRDDGGIEADAWMDDEAVEQLSPSPAARPEPRPPKPAPVKKATESKAPSIRMGKVTNAGALVYRNANFDSKIVTKLEAGKSYPISSKTVGPFYKIKVKDGVYGYVADTDVKLILSAKEQEAKKKESAEKKAEKREERQKKAAENRAKKPFEFQKYRGLSLTNVNFREETMGLRPTETLMFYGAKFSGPDVLVDGGYVDANVLLHFGAPKYYADATGKSADGLIMLLDFLFQSAIPGSEKSMTLIGFGPMLKYSKFSVALPVAGKEEAYELVDMSVGVAFNAAYAYKFDSFALRGEIKYYWEKMQYTALGLAVQFPF